MWWLLLACDADPQPSPPAPAPPVGVVAPKPPARGPAAAVARFRDEAPWDHAPVADVDLVAVLRAVDAWPPGMKDATPAAENAAERAAAPVWLELRRPTGEWLEAGGRAIVSGAVPVGGTVRATLRGDADTAFAWVYEHGDGTGWAPLATVAWEKAR